MQNWLFERHVRNVSGILSVVGMRGMVVKRNAWSVNTFCSGVVACEGSAHSTIYTNVLWQKVAS